MFEFTTTFRVMYADTDAMGIMYYGNYARYYEMGRTEAMRSLGLPYTLLEASGIGMPVIHMDIRFMKPAYYDDNLRLKVIISQVPSSRIRFQYEISNEAGEIINEAETTLVFLHLAKKRPVRAPEILVNKLKEFIKET